MIERSWNFRYDILDSSQVEPIILSRFYNVQELIVYYELKTIEKREIPEYQDNIVECVSLS